MRAQNAFGTSSETSFKRISVNDKKPIYLKSNFLK